LLDLNEGWVIHPDVLRRAGRAVPPRAPQRVPRGSSGPDKMRPGYGACTSTANLTSAFYAAIDDSVFEAVVSALEDSSAHAPVDPRSPWGQSDAPAVEGVRSRGNQGAKEPRKPRGHRDHGNPGLPGACEATGECGTPIPSLSIRLHATGAPDYRQRDSATQTEPAAASPL
jgi:hypothetical protein